MAESVEQYAARTGKLHPEIIRILQPFFVRWDLNNVRISFALGWLGYFSGRGAVTACFTWRGTIEFMRGVLNQTGIRYSNNWDLATAEGMAGLAHECLHIRQYDEGRTPGVFAMLGGIVRSIFTAGKLYDHAQFDFEQEAIEFQEIVERDLASRVGVLAVFEGLR